MSCLSCLSSNTMFELKSGFEPASEVYKTPALPIELHQLKLIKLWSQGFLPWMTPLELTGCPISCYPQSSWESALTIPVTFSGLTYRGNPASHGNYGSYIFRTRNLLTESLFLSVTTTLAFHELFDQPTCPYSHFSGVSMRISKQARFSLIRWKFDSFVDASPHSATPQLDSRQQPEVANSRKYRTTISGFLLIVTRQSFSLNKPFIYSRMARVNRDFLMRKS